MPESFEEQERLRLTAYVATPKSSNLRSFVATGMRSWSPCGANIRSNGSPRSCGQEPARSACAARSEPARSPRYGVVSFACRTSTRSITGAPARS